MKKITNKTILRKGHQTFQSVEVDDVVYWGKKSDEDWFNLIVDDEYWYIVAQSQPKLEGVPVISLDRWVDRFIQSKLGLNGNIRITQLNLDTAQWLTLLKECIESNPNQYTQRDIEKAMNAARNIEVDIFRTLKYTFSNETILEAINSISVIEVDEKFNILSYD